MIDVREQKDEIYDNLVTTDYRGKEIKKKFLDALYAEIERCENLVRFLTEDTTREVKVCQTCLKRHVSQVNK